MFGKNSNPQGQTTTGRVEVSLDTRFWGVNIGCSHASKHAISIYCVQNNIFRRPRFLPLGLTSLPVKNQVSSELDIAGLVECRDILT